MEGWIAVYVVFWVSMGEAAVVFVVCLYVCVWRGGGT